MTMFRTLSAALLGGVLVMGSTGTAWADGHGHGHGHHKAKGHGSGAHAHGVPLMIKPGPSAPAVALNVTQDAMSGWNVQVVARNFRFAPENASGPHNAGEGHAHLYVNNKKIARMYGPWFHIGKLPQGGAVIRVTLNTNDHRDLSVGGKLVEAVVTVGSAAAKKRGMKDHGGHKGHGGHGAHKGH